MVAVIAADGMTLTLRNLSVTSVIEVKVHIFGV